MSNPKTLNCRQAIERIIFLQGDSAIEALEIYNEEGIDAAFAYLSEWHYPGEHETSDTLGAGTSDCVYKSAEYVLTVNESLGYIGLEYVIGGK